MVTATVTMVREVWRPTGSARWGGHHRLPVDGHVLTLRDDLRGTALTGARRHLTGSVGERDAIHLAYDRPVDLAVKWFWAAMPD